MESPAASSLRRARWPVLARVSALVGAIVLAGTACRSLPPGPIDTEARGTLAGGVRGPEGVAPVENRLVEAVEVDTGYRESTKTNVLGEFSLLLPPGRYRIEVALAPGEAVVEEPGVIELGPSELVPHADVVLGGAGVVGED